MTKEKSFFSKQLRKIMFEKKITQKVLAGELGIAQTDVSRWIGGYRNPNISSIKKVAAFFKVPLNYFLEDEEFDINDTVNKKMIIDMKNKIDLILEKLIKQEKEKNQ